MLFPRDFILPHELWKILAFGLIRLMVVLPLLQRWDHLAVRAIGVLTLVMAFVLMEVARMGILLKVQSGLLGIVAALNQVLFFESEVYILAPELVLEQVVLHVLKR